MLILMHLTCTRLSFVSLQNYSRKPIYTKRFSVFSLSFSSLSLKTHKHTHTHTHRGRYQSVSMEELFQYMKTFRSQINDVADQAAKISVEEHMQCSTIETLQKDLDLVKNEVRKVKEETDQMNKAKGEICLQLLDKQRKITYLESDSSTLNQTLELMQQERLSLSTKLVDRRTNYKKVSEDFNQQLKEQQDWVNAKNFGTQIRDGSVNKRADGTQDIEDDVGRRVMLDFQTAQSKYDTMEQLKSNLVLKNTELRQSVDIVKTKMTEFKTELREMDEKSLEDELQALQSDKSGEAEYVHTLKHQIMRLKDISHTIKCSCGEEYIAKLDA